LRHLKANLRQIDDDAIRIAESEDAHFDLLGEIGDEARARLIAGKPGVVGDRLFVRARFGRLWHGEVGAKQPKEERQEA
jgi:hypothetical protein